MAVHWAGRQRRYAARRNTYCWVQRGVHTWVARVNQARRRGRENNALLMRDERRSWSAHRHWREVRIPAQAQGQGQSGLHSELIVKIRIDLPSLDIGQFARSLGETAHVTQQPVGNPIAGVVAAKVDESIGRIVGCVFDRPLVLQIDAHRHVVTVNGLDQCVQIPSVPRTSFEGSVQPPFAVPKYAPSM